MGRPKRNLQAAAEETLSPPDTLTSTQTIARVVKAEGSNLYRCFLPSIFSPPSGREILFELPSKFRNTIWIKRGGYVLVDTAGGEERDNKLGGEILNVVRDEKMWRKASYWPVEFKKVDPYGSDSDEGPQMPPSDSEDDY